MIARARHVALLVVCLAGCGGDRRKVGQPMVGEHRDKSRGFVPSAPRAYEAGCAIFKPCHVTEPPACAADGPAPVALPDLLGAAEPRPGAIRITGVLALEGRWCTDSSPPAECGDDCGGELQLTVAGQSIKLVGGYECAGDDSGVCCSQPIGATVMVSGEHDRVVDTGENRLRVQSFCTP